MQNVFCNYVMNDCILMVYTMYIVCVYRQGVHYIHTLCMYTCMFDDEIEGY